MIDETAQLIGHSPKIQAVAHIIERVAQTDIPVLVQGESGSGKEVVARLLHLKSSRRGMPFLKVNCAAIPHELLESELFGFERGSFTGAYNPKPGKFEMAHQGTIFMDEISEMSLSLQPKLLQVLQDRHFSRLGAQQEISVDVRLISAANTPLEKLLSDGKFREDLYYRLNVVTITVPPLRERKEDIPELARYLLNKHEGNGNKGKVVLSGDLLETFQRYDWPGNVRELENAIRKLLAVGNEAQLLDNFSFGMPGEPASILDPDLEDLPGVSLKEVARLAARQAEREMILVTLQKTNWNRKRAAELLKISYKAMLYKLKDAGIVKHPRAVYSE